MLPGGKLSLHGYTVRWNFFDGVCWGAKHLPFEQDISLIEQAIKGAAANRADLQHRIAALRAPVVPGTATAWVRTYVPASFEKGKRHSSYRWDEVEVTATRHDYDGGFYMTFYYRHPTEKTTDGNASVERLQSLNAKSRDAAVQELNEERAAFLAGRVKQLTDYIEWQQGRIKGWKPVPLTPITEHQQRARKGPLVHFRHPKFPRSSFCGRSLHGGMMRSINLASTATVDEVTCPKCLDRITTDKNAINTAGN